MAEYAAWRLGEFLRIVILYLWDKPGGASSGEIMAAITRSTNLTDEDTRPAPGSGGFASYEVATRGAMSALEKAGWLAHEDSVWSLTGEGLLACQDFRDASDFYRESQRILEQWRNQRTSLHLALEYGRDMAREQVRQFLLSLPRPEFRTLVADLLQALGYFVEWMAPSGKQRGTIDLVALPDPLGVKPGRLMVQIRHSDQVISADALETLRNATHPDNLVLCVSSGGFTAEARDYAAALTPGTLVLMDLEKFVAAWVEHFEQLTDAARQRFPLEAVYFLSLTE
jgi:restriction system protein